ncbi:MAG: DNA polymerase I [Anaerovoracaceae bacterium]|jgi:DNA polymerase-1
MEQVNEKRILIIDGNSLINRAYYAMQKPMITRDGLYTQGIYGFLNMLEKLRRDVPSGYLVVAFDLKAPTFRHKEYDEYKAGRRRMPPELAMEIPVLKEVLAAMRVKMLAREGFEADDVIGTVARRGEEEGLTPLIVTGDKDELQLASKQTTVMITRRGISQFQLYDYDAMVEEYGFTPQQFIDYKGLMGDPSDNLPGLPGVGDKTARRLVKTYGSVEEVLAHSDELKGKLRRSVEENGQQALMSKRLATISTQVPLELDFAECRWGGPDHDRLVELYKKLEFNSFLKRMGKDLDSEEKEAANHYHELEIEPVMLHGTDLARLEEALQPGALVVLKVFGNQDHRDRPILHGAGLLVDSDYYYIDLTPEGSGRELARILAAGELHFMGHDLKNDYYMLMYEGMTSFVTAFDTAIAQYVLDSGRSNYDLTTLAQEYFHRNIENEKEFMEQHAQADLFRDDAADFAAYGLKWCGLVAQLMLVQQEAVAAARLSEVLETAELPLVQVMAEMEYAGFRLDRRALEQTGAGLRTRVAELTEEIYRRAGEEFNIKSPQQLGHILFEKMGLPAGKKTKKGYSTSAAVLEKIRDRDPIVPLILEYRQLTKLEGTYIDGLLPLVHTDGRIHARFHQTVTATGRISSSDPNLQNIPVRQELGRQIRRAFIPASEEYTLLSADYSQIELRILAHVSGDQALIDSFNNGEDIHRATAARVLGIPEEEITAEQRSRAKAVNFGVIYGMSAFGLSSNLSITRKEAEAYIESYFDKHPAVRAYMDRQVEYCRENGYVKTLLGRRRYISEIGARSFRVRSVGERLAMNSPIQGSAADIIKLAMIRVDRALRGTRSRLLLQVHDELIIETFRAEREEVERMLVEAMEGAMKLKVPLLVDVHSGDSWYDLK